MRLILAMLVAYLLSTAGSEQVGDCNCTEVGTQGGSEGVGGIWQCDIPLRYLLRQVKYTASE